MPDQRPIADDDAQEILDALAAKDAVQVRVEKAVARALLNGASIRSVTEATGLSPATVQKYGRAHGWPTKENRARFYETRWDRHVRDREQ